MVNGRLLTSNDLSFITYHLPIPIIMRKIIIPALVLLISIISLTAQSLPPFERLILTGNLSVLLVEGERENLDIKNDAEQVEFKVEGRTLNIIAKDLIRYNKTPTVKLVVTYTTIREIKAHAGAAVYSDQVLEIDALKLKFTSGAVGEITAYTQTLITSVSEGGTLELSGSTNFHEAKATTGGALVAYDLDCQEVLVRANTGGSAKLLASESIDATAKTGGSISYKGKPKKVREKDGLSGTIRSY